MLLYFVCPFVALFPFLYGNCLFVYVIVLWLVFVVCLSTSLVCFVRDVMLCSCCFCCWCLCFVCGVLCCCLLFHWFVVRVWCVVVLVSCLLYLLWFECFPCV